MTDLRAAKMGNAARLQVFRKGCSALPIKRLMPLSSFVMIFDDYGDSASFLTVLPFKTFLEALWAEEY